MLAAVLAAAPGGKPKAAEVQGWLGVAQESFREALYDDLNLAGALSALSGLLDQTASLSKQERPGREDADAVPATLSEMDEVLSLLPAEGQAARG